MNEVIVKMNHPNTTSVARRKKKNEVRGRPNRTAFHVFTTFQQSIQAELYFKEVNLFRT